MSVLRINKTLQKDRKDRVGKYPMGSRMKHLLSELECNWFSVAFRRRYYYVRKRDFDDDCRIEKYRKL